MTEITKFVAACCCWPHTQDTQARVREAASALNNWEYVKKSVVRHRVSPLVHMAVKNQDSVPESFRLWAGQEAQKTAIGAMQLTHDCIKIDTALKAADLRPLHFKGPVLAQLAYGSVALKYSYDLDVFVEKQYIFTAIKVLEQAGYRASNQKGLLSERQIVALLKIFKDIAFTHPSGRVIELHWKFTNTNSLMAELLKDLQRQQVMVADLAVLDTFSTPQMLTHLCVHGAIHQWERLKWLADVAAFLNKLPSEERANAISAVHNGPNSDALAQTLKLCDTFFGTTYAPKLSRRAQALYNNALARIEEPFDGRNWFFREVGIIRRYYGSRHVYRNTLSAIWSLKYMLICKNDMLRMPLPTILFGIYPIIRFPSLLIRRLRR